MSTTTENSTGESDEGSLSRPVSFDEKDGRLDAMQADLEEWIERLADLVEEARGEKQLKELLEVQSKFHDYSVNNQILILRQMPEATKVAGYNTWKEMGRYVKEGESAIWIWAPLTTNKCPECGNGPSYHHNGKVDCDYHETVAPDTWSQGVVGFKPVPVYDISQTDGDPLPSVDDEINGDASTLLPALIAAAEDLPLELDIVPEAEWDREAEGICTGHSVFEGHPTIEVKDQSNDANLARVIVHEIGHALLHYTQRAETPEREKREVEAEAVAYVVCQHYGLDASNARFYLAAWSDEAADDLRERVDRIQATAGDVIEAVNSELPASATPGQTDTPEDTAGTETEAGA
jgi:uncharacterized Zn finger protein (UPF0148 family)